MSDRDQDRQDKDAKQDKQDGAEQVGQALEQALKPTKDMPSQLESDLAEALDPALGTGRGPAGPAREAPSAGEPGDPRR
jgi:hypothetical protein